MRESTKKEISALIRREVVKAHRDFKWTAVQVEHQREKLTMEHPDETAQQIERRIEMTDLYRVHLNNIAALGKAAIMQNEWERTMLRG